MTIGNTGEDAISAVSGPRTGDIVSGEGWTWSSGRLHAHAERKRAVEIARLGMARLSRGGDRNGAVDERRLEFARRERLIGLSRCIVRKDDAERPHGTDREYGLRCQRAAGGWSVEDRIFAHDEAKAGNSARHAFHRRNDVCVRSIDGSFAELPTVK